MKLISVLALFVALVTVGVIGSVRADTVSAQEPAQLTIVKECDQGDTSGQSFTIAIDGPDNTSVDLDCGDTSDPVTLTPGDYVVSETPPSGYDDPSIRGACDGDGTVTLEAGLTYTCVVHNYQLPEEPAQLTIVKECDQGDTSGQSFTIAIDGPDNTSVDLDCGDTSDPISLTPGDYVISETPPSGYDDPSIRGASKATAAYRLPQARLRLAWSTTRR